MGISASAPVAQRAFLPEAADASIPVVLGGASRPLDIGESRRSSTAVHRRERLFGSG